MAVKNCSCCCGSYLLHSRTLDFKEDEATLLYVCNLCRHNKYVKMPNPVLYAGLQATKDGCSSCCGSYVLHSRTLAFSKEDEAMVATLLYICNLCRHNKYVSLPMRGQPYKQLADAERKKLAR